jgi:hypothetical protein
MEIIYLLLYSFFLHPAILLLWPLARGGTSVLRLLSVLVDRLLVGSRLFVLVEIILTAPDTLGIVRGSGMSSSGHRRLASFINSRSTIGRGSSVLAATTVVSSLCATSVVLIVFGVELLHQSLVDRDLLALRAELDNCLIIISESYTASVTFV